MTALTALALTVAVELPLYVLGLVALRLTDVARAVLLGLGVNLLTHPVLWHVLTPDPSVLRVCLAESCVCLVEAAVIWLVVRRDALLVVVMCVGVNAASVGVGALFNAGVV